MEPILIYFGKMIVCSAVMYAYYVLFLKDKTFHHYNRFYLLGTVIISIFLPFLKVSYFTIEINNKFLLLLTNLQSTSINPTHYVYNYYTIVFLLFGLVSVFLLGKLLFGLSKINQIKKQNPHEEIQGINFYQTNLEEAPFSFFKNLFWKRSIELNSKIGQQILKHEMVHIEQKHTWDKLFLQVVKSIFWMNPLFYIINKEINLIHEYLADNKAVEKSDTKAFAQMLLASYFPGTQLPATSPFLSSNLKKRLKMLSKNKTKYSYMHKLLALPVLFTISFAYMVNAKNKEIKQTNNALELAITEIKNDTISPSKSKMLEARKGLGLSNQEIVKENRKIAEISKEISAKNKEISSLIKSKKTDTPEFAAKEKELDILTNKIDEITNSSNYQEHLKNTDQFAVVIEDYYNSPEYKAKLASIEKRAKEMEAKFNSPEYKAKLALIEKRAKEMEAKFNTPEYKANLALIEKRAKEMEVKFNTPEYKAKMKDLEKRAKEMEAKFNTPEFKKLIESTSQSFVNGATAFSAQFADPKVLSAINFDSILEDLPVMGIDASDFFMQNNKELTPKDKRKIEKKRKELEKLQKELNEKRKSLIQDRPWTVVPKSNNTISFNYQSSTPNNILAVDGDSTLKYFVNDKEVSAEMLKNIDAKSIKSVSVSKQNGKGTMRIFTKG